MNLILHEHLLKNYDDLIQKLKGVKYICMHGSGERAFAFANKWTHLCLKADPGFFVPVNILNDSLFYAYRVGNVLSISHGMGSTSILIMLNFLTQLMYKCGNKDFHYIRIGTSGGLGVEPGSVILTENTYLPDFSSKYRMDCLDSDMWCDMQMNNELNQQILAANPSDLGFKAIMANTMSANDFYLGQARRDGAIKPSFTEEERQAYFAKAQELNIVNIEMEAAALGAFCSRFKISGAMIAVTLVDRIKGDQVTITPEQITRYCEHAQDLVLNYLLKTLS